MILRALDSCAQAQSRPRAAPIRALACRITNLPPPTKEAREGMAHGSRRVLVRSPAWTAPPPGGGFERGSRRGRERGDAVGVLENVGFGDTGGDPGAAVLGRGGRRGRGGGWVRGGRVWGEEAVGPRRHGLVLVEGAALEMRLAERLAVLLDVALALV
jgi:hypothetical protein